MKKHRQNLPSKSHQTEDFKELTRTDREGNEKLTTPPSDVLKYVRRNGWIAIRPSGTGAEKSNFISV